MFHKAFGKPTQKRHVSSYTSLRGSWLYTNWILIFYTSSSLRDSQHPSPPLRMSWYYHDNTMVSFAKFLNSEKAQCNVERFTKTIKNQSIPAYQSAIFVLQLPKRRFINRKTPIFQNFDLSFSLRFLAAWAFSCPVEVTNIQALRPLLIVVKLLQHDIKLPWLCLG